MAVVVPGPSLLLLTKSKLLVEVELKAKAEQQAVAKQLVTRSVLMWMVSNQLGACSLLS